MFSLVGNCFSQVLIPFVKRYGVTQPGGLELVGNAILSCDGSAPSSGSIVCGAAQSQTPPSGTSKDNDFKSGYIDVDGDATTFSSSSADLSLAACSKITFAGLYWGAVITNGTTNFANRYNIKIKAPGASSYTSITADTAFDLSSGYNYYSCFKDITSIVSAAGNGTFTIADLVSNTGSTNQWAGWSIVVVYKNELMAAKNITVFDGLGYVNNSGSSVTVNVNGFYTPPGGAVNFELGEITYDGDRGLTGDSLLFKGASAFVSVSDAMHPADDVFNSSFTNNAVEDLSRNPAYSNTLGYDQCTFKPNNAAKNYLSNGATSAQIKVTTGGEQIFLRALTSVIDTYEPELAMKKTVTDLDGGAVNPGDTLLYTITVTNAGNDTSSTTLITDTLPFNCVYVPESVIITGGPNLGSKTDASGDDQSEFSAPVGNQILTIRMGNGANATTGGQLPFTGTNSTSSLTFKVKITDDCTELLCNPVISNRASINYSGFISGLSRNGKSNPLLFDSLGCPIEGYTATSITVPVSCTPPPDSAIGACLPVVFSTIPNIRPGYVYYNSSWASVTQANVVGLYYGIRKITGTSCADTIKYTVYIKMATPANAGPDQTVCNAASVTMSGNSAAVGGGTWTTVSGPNSPTITSPNNKNTTITGLIPGTYKFAWTISVGCNSTSDTMTVVNNPLPTPSNAGANQSLCNVTSTTLAGNTPTIGTGTWTLVSGPNTPVITTPSSPTTTVTSMIPGVYVFRWSIVNGSCGASTSDVQVTIYALPTTSNAGANQSLCNTTTTTLTGNSVTSGSGNWTLISGPNVPTITSPGISNTGVTGMVSGVYVFRWTITNGVCASSTSDVQITIYSPSTVSDAGPDQDLCNVISTTLAGNTPTAGSGLWTLVSGPNSPTITTPSSPTSSVTGMITGVYIFSWTISNGACPSSSSNVQITNSSLPTPSNAGPNQGSCNVATSTLAANTPASGTGTWSQVSGPNAASITSVSNPSTTVTGLVTGVYIFRWTISNGSCAVSTSDVQISNYAPPTAANAGANQSWCNVTSTTLTGNNPVVGTGNWSQLSGPNAATITTTSNPSTTVTGMIPGIYVFRWTISNGSCFSSASSVQVTIYATPTISDAGPDQDLCNVTSTTFAGNTPTAGSGLWTFVSGPNLPSITTPSSETSSVTGMISGVYVFKWTISNGVCASSSNNVTITISPTPTVADANVDQDLCNVNNTTLAANVAVSGSGIWTIISGPNSPTITTPTNPGTTVTGMIVGVYVFRWSISSGACAVSTDDIQVTIYGLPSASNAGVDQNLCNVSSTTLAGNNPAVGAGTWTLVSGPNVPVITTPTLRNTTVTGMIPGVYVLQWTISNGVCASTNDLVQITIYDLPTTSVAGADQSLCNVTSTTLAGNTPTVGSGVWSLISGPNVPTIVAPSNPSSSVAGMIKGVYVFRWTISNGVCASSTSNVQVTIYALPTVANAGPNQSLCNVASTTLAGNNALVGTGTWSIISGPNAPTITSPNSPSSSITGMIAGVYIFQWSITNGVCAASTANVQITIYALPTVSNAGVDQSLCNVTSTSLAGNSPTSGTGNWTLISGPNIPTITTPSSATSTVTGMVIGTYFFRWTITNGVCATSTDDVKIIIYAIPTIATVGPNQDVCSVTSVSLVGNRPTIGAGQWTLASGPNVPVITNPDSATTTVTSMITGSYQFTWTISNGVCASTSADVTVTIYNQPTFIDAGPDQALCNVTSTTMAGNVPAIGTGTWTLISGPNIPAITDVNDPGTTITGMVIGTYQYSWQIENGVCKTDPDTISIINYDLPSTSNAGANQDLCSVTTITLHGNVPVVGNGVWSLVSGPNVPVITNPTQANTTVTGMIDGVYFFQWDISSGPCAISSSTTQITIYNAPTFVDAGLDQNLCNVNSVTMNANVPAIGTGAWTFLTGPNSPTITSVNDPATTVTGMIPGEYLLGWSISNGVCVTDVDTVIVSIYDLPTVADAGADQNLCNTDSAFFAGNLATIGSGQWTLLSGPNIPIIENDTINNSKVSGMISGNYSFIWTISNGVCTSSSDTMQITIFDLPVIPNAGADQSLCNIDSVVMSANASPTGSWSIASGPNSPTITNAIDSATSITGLIPGTYVFVWTINSGVCSPATDSVEVSVYALPTIATAGSDQDLCNLSSTTFAGNNPVVGNGNWAFISGPNIPLIAVPSDPSSPVSGLIAGVYEFTWEISNGVCASSIDTVQVNVYDLPTVADAGADQELCGASSATMNGNSPLTGTGIWTNLSGPNIPTITSNSDPLTTVTNLIPGTYSFAWTISNGSCLQSIDTVEITTYQFPPVVDAGSDQALCNATTTTLSGNAIAAGTGFWNFISGPNSPIISSPSSPATNVNGMIAGIYLFSWNVVNGVCAVYSDTVQVSIDALPSNANAGIDQSLCNVSSITLAGNNPTSGNGNWTLISGPNIPTIVSPNSGTTSVNGVVPGTYIYEWRISNGVCASSMDSVQIDIYNIPSIVDAGADQSLCNIYTTSMAANVPATGVGSWSLISGPVMPTIASVNDPFTAISGLTAGTFIFGWTINNGVCSTALDSIIIDVFDQTSFSNAGTDQIICNDTSATLNGNNPTAGAGVWSQLSGPNLANIVSPGNPSTIVTNLVSGNYFLIWTISNGSCSTSSDTVEIIINNLPDVAAAGQDQILCNVTSVTMAANAPVVGVGNWTLIFGPNTPTIVSSSNENTTIMGMVPGTYSFRWTITNSICAPNFDDVTIQIYALPSVASAGSPQVLCNVNSISLSGNVPASGSGSWLQVSGPNTSNIISPTAANTTVNGITEGVYEFSWTISNGVCASSVDTVTISIDSLPSVADAGIDQSVCIASVLTLTGNNPLSGTGSWTNISGPNSPVISSPSSPVTIASGFIPGVYDYTWTISNGVCASTTDTVRITVYDLPNVAYAGNNQNACIGSLITLDANDAINGSGSWTLVSGPNIPAIINPDSAHTLVTGNVSGLYIFRWTITNGICTSTYDDVNVLIDSIPVSTDAGLDQSFCNLNDVNLTGNVPLFGTGSWLTLYGPNSPTIVSPLTESTLVTGLVQGIYEFRWQVTNGTCSAFDDVKISLNAPPSVFVTQHLYTTCGGRHVAILEAGGAATYSWSPSYNLSNAFIYNPSVTVDQAIQYTVVGTDANGCTGSDTLSIEICGALTIPSGFSPDGDGLNDNFEIVGIENYPGNFFHVFNRWGNVVYEKRDYDNSWDGTPNQTKFIIGKDKVPAGTYFYLLDLGSLDKPRTGYIIIRY